MNQPNEESLPAPPRLIGRRPWGHYEVLLDEERLKIKRIVVAPGARLSLQRHRLRQEHWYVAEGVARVTLDESLLELSAGRAVDIPTGSWHRVANPGDTDLVMIEVQTGSYFGEDDIERREDDYGRIGSS